MAEHRQDLQRELEGIEAKVIELFALVAEDLARATDALLSGNNEIVKVLAEREAVIGLPPRRRPRGARRRRATRPAG